MDLNEELRIKLIEAHKKSIEEEAREELRIKREEEAVIEEAVILKREAVIEEAVILKREAVTLKRKEARGMACVYFFGNWKKYIKIGYTQKPNDRFSAINCHSPVSIEIIGHTPMMLIDKAKCLEKELHDKFQKDNYKGEWFIPSKDLLKTIFKLSI